MSRTAHDILVVSPDQELARSILTALAETAVVRDVRLETDYPATEVLKDLLSPVDHPITAVIVAVSKREQAFSLIGDIRMLNPGMKVIAAASESSEELLRDVADAGVRELIAPPLHPSQIIRCLDAEIQTSHGQSICFVPAQAGDGATTLALEAATAITELTGHRSVLLDLDLHSSALAFRMRLDPLRGLADALEVTAHLEDVWKQIVTPARDFDVLTAPPRDQKPGASACEGIPSLLQLMTHLYPVAVADLPVPLEPYHGRILAAADVVVLVCTPDLISVHLTRNRLEDLQHYGVEADKIRLALNKTGRSNELRTEAVTKATGIPPAFVFGSDPAAVKEAIMNGVASSPKSALGRQSRDFVGGILGVHKAPTPSGVRKWLKLVGLERPLRAALSRVRPF